MSLLKKILLVLVLIVSLLTLDLYTFEFILQDPGYYVVARRSDRPSQVRDALNKLDPKTLTRGKLNVLKNRYDSKANNGSLSPAQRRKWKQASRQVREILRANFEHER